MLQEPVLLQDSDQATRSLLTLLETPDTSDKETAEANIAAKNTHLLAIYATHGSTISW